MLKKHGFKFLIAVMVLQLLVPAVMIANAAVIDFRTERYGTQYKFKVDNLLIYDDWLMYTPTEYEFKYLIEHKTYSSISVGADGYAVVTWSDEKPEGTSYIKNEGNYFEFPKTRLDKSALKIPENMIILKYIDGYVYSADEIRYKDAYIDVYVYKGKVKIKDLYIDSVPAEEFFTQINEHTGVR